MLILKKHIKLVEYVFPYLFTLLRVELTLIQVPLKCSPFCTSIIHFSLQQKDNDVLNLGKALDVFYLGISKAKCSHLVPVQVAKCLLPWHERSECRGPRCKGLIKLKNSTTCQQERRKILFEQKRNNVFLFGTGLMKFSLLA